jgi:hypothetical protein
MFCSKTVQNDPWLCRLPARKPTMVAAVAQQDRSHRLGRHAARRELATDNGAIVPIV